MKRAEGPREHFPPRQSRVPVSPAGCFCGLPSERQTLPAPAALLVQPAWPRCPSLSLSFRWPSPLSPFSAAWSLRSHPGPWGCRLPSPPSAVSPRPVRPSASQTLSPNPSAPPRTPGPSALVPHPRSLTPTPHPWRPRPPRPRKVMPAPATDLPGPRLTSPPASDSHAGWAAPRCGYGTGPWGERQGQGEAGQGRRAGGPGPGRAAQGRDDAAGPDPRSRLLPATPPPPAGSGWGRLPAFVQSGCRTCAKTSGAGAGLGDVAGVTE